MNAAAFVAFAILALVVTGCAISVGNDRRTVAGDRAALSTDEQAAAKAEVSGVLDALHAAAARADAAAYWPLFDDSAVFLGTDASERWTLEQFRAYADPHFASGKGWAYTSTSRSIALDGSGRVAWFDELLSNAKYGTCRGSGVLVRSRGGVWRIAQYNLSVPIPNDLLPSVAEQIRRAGP